MANNYCELSSMLKIPEDKMEQAGKILDRALNELMEKNEYYDILVTFDEGGAWFRSDESADPDDVEFVAKMLVEELKIDEPFFCSWGYTCSKKRVDEFGGGAFVVRRGLETYWVDAMDHVCDLVRLKKDEPKLHHTPMFGDPVAPWHLWFAWFPVRTWDGRLVWLSKVKRRLIQKHTYLSGPSYDWWEYERGDNYVD